MCPLHCEQINPTNHPPKMDSVVISNSTSETIKILEETQSDVKRLLERKNNPSTNWSDIHDQLQTYIKGLNEWDKKLKLYPDLQRKLNTVMKGYVHNIC